MRQRSNLLAVGLGILFTATGCGLAARERTKVDVLGETRDTPAQAACLPRFPDRDGWFGGDSAASVVLPQGDGRSSLWLFGDSFVARAGSPPVRAYPLVHNSIAISHCGDGGDWQLDFAWGSRSDGAPQAFFEPDPAAAWVVQLRRETGEAPYYWPISAVSIRGTIFVALLRVAAADERGPFRLPFQLAGVDLARIEKADRPIPEWTIRYSTLATRADAFPAASLVASGDHLHAFAFLDRGDGRNPRILTRLPLSSLDAWRPELEGDLETLAGDGSWTAGLDPDRARLLMDDDASEMSVHFNPGLREWLAVYSDPTNSQGDLPADTLWLRRAPSLEGPWSERAPLLRIPELAPAPDPGPGAPFCYAGKAHPQFAGPGQLVVTYVCNLFAEPGDEVAAVLERLRLTPSLYRPRAVRLSIPGGVPGVAPATVLPPAVLR
jgi:hypothetical protein